MQEQETFNPMLQSWHSKIDLPTPNELVLYCVRKIKNYPDLGYAYLTVLVGRAGAPHETTLFYNYGSVPNYSRFLEDIKDLCPHHCTRIKDSLVTFHKAEECPCGWEQENLELQ